MSEPPRPPRPYEDAPRLPEGEAVDLRTLVAGEEIELEIGPGRGGFLFERADAAPSAGLVGLEIRRKWATIVDRRLDKRGYGRRARVFAEDAKVQLPRLGPDGVVARLFLHFPDPWWKKRHHKRRVFTSDFTALLARLLAPDGDLVAKTDVPAYVDQMIDEALGAGLELVGQGTSDPVLAALPRSHREKKCLELEVPFQMLRFRRTRGP